ncbi:hypothetical protein [Chthonobacter albigriseus]|uniref:hypothetical protein n=1 Tax=Chthonobacter albigriseus TaxID=1683161 RepID=UPI0015EF24D0|nr:hypothetical protein [Chthonobacter albigriseus]
MNTANLQLEGLYTALTALLAVLREKNVLSREDVDEALDRAERSIEADARRPAEVSGSNRDAVRFPVRYLRQVNRALEGGELPSFTDVAGAIGAEKAGR